MQQNIALWNSLCFLYLQKHIYIYIILADVFFFSTWLLFKKEINAHEDDTELIVCSLVNVNYMIEWILWLLLYPISFNKIKLQLTGSFNLLFISQYLVISCHLPIIRFLYFYIKLKKLLKRKINRKCGHTFYWIDYICILFYIILIFYKKYRFEIVKNVKNHLFVFIKKYK